MAQKGSQFRAEANPALRTVCARCGKSIPTEVGHPHPLDAEDRGVWRETWGLVGIENGSPKVFPTCHECYQAGWRLAAGGLCPLSQRARRGRAHKVSAEARKAMTVSR